MAGSAASKQDLEARIARLRLAGPSRQLAFALRDLGELSRKFHDPATALAAYQEAVGLLRADARDLKLAHTVRHLGDVHLDARRASEAELCYVEALAIYRSHPDPDPLDFANAIRVMAILREQQGEKAVALALWREAGTLYQRCGVTLGVDESRRRADKLSPF